MGNVFQSHKCLTISFTVCIITHAEAQYGLTLTSFVVRGFLGVHLGLQDQFIYPQVFKDL